MENPLRLRGGGKPSSGFKSECALDFSVISTPLDSLKFKSTADYGHVDLYIIAPLDSSTMYIFSIFTIKNGLYIDHSSGELIS